MKLGSNRDYAPLDAIVSSTRLVSSSILVSSLAKAEGTSSVTWEIEPVGDSCRLTVTHDQLREGANPELYGGWPMVLSGLKTPVDR